MLSGPSSPKAPKAATAPYKEGPPPDMSEDRRGGRLRQRCSIDLIDEICFWARRWGKSYGVRWTRGHPGARGGPNTYAIYDE